MIMAINPTDMLKLALFPSQTLYEVLNNNIKDFSHDAEDSSLKSLEEEAFREEIKARVMENQAKVAQELAIAKRIEESDEVEIEEYYDLSGEAHIGAKSNVEGVSLGASAEGRKITKRVIKFKGGKSIQQIYDDNK